MRFLPLLATMLAATPALAEDDCPAGTGAGSRIGHARLFIEDNVPDEDIGVHGLFDDHGWRVLCVHGPGGTRILTFEPSGPPGDLGVAGFFFESNEPPCDACDHDALRAALAEGDYTVRGRNIDGTVLAGTAHFTPVVALPPVILYPESVADEEADLPLECNGAVAMTAVSSAESRAVPGTGRAGARRGACAAPTLTLLPRGGARE